MTSFSLSPGAASIVAPALLVVDGVRVVERDPRMDAPIAETEQTMRSACEAGHTVTDVRAMYRRFGVDPTKTRPSSEALLRRIRKGEPLPRINSLVDIGNWCSLESQLPFGLYDLRHIEGPVELRLGREGEEYPGIRKDMIHLAGRLTLADEKGPFGNPSADSARTLVTPSTTSVLVVIFAPAGMTPGPAERALALTESRVLEYAGGTVSQRMTTDVAAGL